MGIRFRRRPVREGKSHGWTMSSLSPMPLPWTINPNSLRAMCVATFKTHGKVTKTQSQYCNTSMCNLNRRILQPVYCRIILLALLQTITIKTHESVSYHILFYAMYFVIFLFAILCASRNTPSLPAHLKSHIRLHDQQTRIPFRLRLPTAANTK